MSSLFDRLALADVHQDLLRNIVSLRRSQDLFDDLSEHPQEWLLAQEVEGEVKPPPYRSATPILDRPFEDAEWFHAISWPFRHWQSSRFSDGSHGVWYGSESVETTVHESAWHWYRGLLCDAGFESLEVVAERKVYAVACDAALLDLRDKARDHPQLLHPSDYAFCQSVGARIHHEGHPGLLTRSVRRAGGENLALFHPRVLSRPKVHGYLSYRLGQGRIAVQRQPGRTWFTLDPESLG